MTERQDVVLASTDKGRRDSTPTQHGPIRDRSPLYLNSRGAENRRQEAIQSSRVRQHSGRRIVSGKQIQSAQCWLNPEHQNGPARQFTQEASMRVGVLVPSVRGLVLGMLCALIRNRVLFVMVPSLVPLWIRGDDRSHGK